MSSATKPGKQAAKEVTLPGHSLPGTYITGFCGIGNHEGTKNLSQSGALMKSCWIGGRTTAPRIGVIICNCSCHDMTREMEKLTGHEIPPVPICEELPIRGVYLKLSAHGPGSDKAGDGRAAVVVASGARFSATPTGRAAKGQLEEQVRHFICTQVAAAGAEMIALLGIQSATISKGIGGESPPSTGAIYSVLKRWETANLVELRERPFAFVRFTDRGERDLNRAPR